MVRTSPDTNRTEARMDKPPSAAVANIEAIAAMEQEFLSRRTRWDRIADAVAAFSGSITFVLLHVGLFTLWFLVNLKLVPFIRPFDPYPFVLLAMVVSCEAVLLSTFVLMKQNRMSRRAEDRDQLHLQIALLTEREVTKVLQAQQRISEHLGVPPESFDTETRELSQETALHELARELREKLPEEGL
jgi:uncharacterized membrane protein